METPVDKIRKKALDLGFYSCGFARAEALEQEKDLFYDYLAQNRNAEMHYLERNPERRLDPRLILEGAKSVVAMLMNYFPSKIIPEDDNYVFAKYAYGKDYHNVLMEKLKLLGTFMKDELGASGVRGFVDSAPLLEKRWAQQCGLGWIGKNTILVSKAAGSFFVIGVLLTDLEITPDSPENNRCGTCEKCVKACPTGALTEPWKLDPNRCIAYHTLENKGEIPAEFTNRFNNRIYGCDICQDVCPFNSFSAANSEPEFAAHPSLFSMKKSDWKELSREKFNELFSGTPVDHIGYDRLMRNIRFVSGTE